MKNFMVKDISGRGFGTSFHNQQEVFDIVDATDSDKGLISSMAVGDSTRDFNGVIITRVG